MTNDLISPVITQCRTSFVLFHCFPFALDLTVQYLCEHGELFRPPWTITNNVRRTTYVCLSVLLLRMYVLRTEFSRAVCYFLAPMCWRRDPAAVSWSCCCGCLCTSQPPRLGKALMVCPWLCPCRCSQWCFLHGISLCCKRHALCRKHPAR